MSDQVIEPYDALETEDDGVYLLPEDSRVFMLPPELVAEMQQASSKVAPEIASAVIEIPAVSSPAISNAPDFLEGDFLEEEVLTPTVTISAAPTLVVPPIMKLERGEYALLTQESPGRVIAKAPMAARYASLFTVVEPMSHGRCIHTQCCQTCWMQANLRAKF